MTAPTLTFLGATGTVTGSRFVVESDGHRVAVDMGLYQGLRELRRRNWEPFPTTLDAVVLTHAHLDHCGYLPRLVRDGFSGPIVCTAETADLAAIVLRDSAHLQQDDAAYANEYGFSKHTPALPLYDESDVEKTLPLFRPTQLHHAALLADHLTATLFRSGHILGSAAVLLRARGTRTLFSGDLGRPNHPLVPAREDPPAADTVVVESTYGDRRHPPHSDVVLGDAITRTIRRGGSVLIPAFAVDRTEIVLLRLGRMMRDQVIPDVAVHLDSPMAQAALRVYRSHLRAIGHHGFEIPRLLIAATPEESRALNRPEHPCIVISASGMASGGRVVHHLAEQLPDARNTVVLTGYQAAGTRGRALLDGAREVKMHGRYVPVRAEIVHDETMSVHADADEVLSWLERMPEPPHTVFVVHGERHSSEALADRIRDELGWCAVVPRLGERVRLGVR